MESFFPGVSSLVLGIPPLCLVCSLVASWSPLASVANGNIAEVVISVKNGARLILLNSGNINIRHTTSGDKIEAAKNLNSDITAFFVFNALIWSVVFCVSWGGDGVELLSCNAISYLI